MHKACTRQRKLPYALATGASELGITHLLDMYQFVHAHVLQEVLVAALVVSAVLLVSAAVSGDTVALLAIPLIAERGAKQHMELAQVGQLLLTLPVFAAPAQVPFFALLGSILGPQIAIMALPLVVKSFPLGARALINRGL